MPELVAGFGIVLAHHVGTARRIQPIDSAHVNGGSGEGRVRVLCKQAARHGFKVIQNGGFWELWHEATKQVLTLYDADTPNEKCITCRVVKNLHANRDDLLRRLGC